MRSDTASIPAAQRPLAGIRVIEACTYMAGPVAALNLADLGAEVIKVEPPTGDPYRGYQHSRNGFSAVWMNSNRGKRSVALDLKDPADLERMFTLLEGADVFIENWRPKVANNLGLTLGKVAARNPRLIRLSITGFGDSGPQVDEPAFDALLQGKSGLVASMAEYGRANPTPFFTADKVSALYATQSILAALVERGRTGKGRHVELAMLDLMAYFNFPELFFHRTFADDTFPYRAPPSVVLETSDGHIVLSPVTGAQLGKTLQVLGHPEWKDDLKQIKDRVAAAHEFFRLIAAPLRERTSAHWLAAFREADIPVGPVCDADQHLNDDQVRHNQIYGVHDTPAGPVRMVRYPALFDGQRLDPLGAAPVLGADNAAVLGS